MTVQVDTFPPTVKAGGIDNAAIVRVPESDEYSYLTNSDVHPEPAMQGLISLVLEQGGKVTLRGPIGEKSIVELDSGKEFVYGIVAKQYKVFDDEQDFDGCWKGSLQFSKFRWALKSLEPATEEEFEKAQEQVAPVPDKADGEQLYNKGLAAIKAGNHEEAISILTLALTTCEIDEEAEDDDNDDPHASLRLQILTARAQASNALGAWRAAVRDGELVERIYGRPVDALNSLKPADAGVYFHSILASAKANEALGNLVAAGSGYMAIMILNMIKEQAAELSTEGQEVPEPVPADVADSLIQQASAALEKLEQGPNTTTIFTLKISLLGIEPPVWRTIKVTANTTLGELREYIIMAFGWCGTPNVHEFEIYDHGVVRFTTIPDDFVIPDDQDDEYDERHEICEDEEATTVGLAVSQVGDTFTFIYEKGDWVHQIVVEEVSEQVLPDACCGHDEEGDHEHNHQPEFPKIIAGARACPPDSVGGPAGYKEFLLAVNGTPSEKFATRLDALNFAAENVGLSNSALDSWGGATKRPIEDMLAGLTLEDDEEENATDDTPKDVNKGGWDPEAFQLEEVGKALGAIAAMMEQGDDDDEWEDEEDDEEEDI
ncbi:uncharacterized protein SPPG_08053 [Spizellomyces punctatus DAOM BR117]|uniref:Plasmid pRiA4b Orf3-like domain-containing protein n=1 Tax=Spizellomyces punctatus (strain DAOM BR117) TaxID=645134 RepID=A0A0L0H4M1_SPIPD|nr:uncharacterized protein SPPG_08053 [Spizellomyces punctatus DAOM BR117]KNC96460.1 hypothetical protein SPPG_08053 [Spizellomyces punctatus DAOM BR117]|eukprot:XP_016604500.1 hypothetical protein SPPG_08053 [Spizellomyces punctatus DAOM BR117]